MANDPYGIYQAMTDAPAVGPDPNAGNPFYNRAGKFKFNSGVTNMIGAGPQIHPAYLDALQQWYGANKDARVRQAGLSSQLYMPDDPMAAFYSRQHAEDSANTDYATGYGAARAQAGQQGINNYNELLRAYMAQQQPKKKSGLASAAGGIAGAGIGALFGPGGAAVGASIGSNAGGGY